MHPDRPGVKDSKAFYDGFHSELRIGAVERIKQDSRLKTLRGLVYSHSRGWTNKRILVAGCGRGGDTIVVDNPVIALDISFNALRIAKRDFPDNIYLTADAGCLPFNGNCFDLIICSEVIEHTICPKTILLEFRRVLKPDGCLIISLPNWISLYGLARKLGEFILKKPLTAAGQPIDNWQTFKSFRQLLAPEFKITDKRGIWYYPPTGKGNIRIPDLLILPMVILLQPIDALLGKILPSIGSHILSLKCAQRTFKPPGSQRASK